MTQGAPGYGPQGQYEQQGQYGPPPGQYGPPPGQYEQPGQYGPPPGQYGQPPGGYPPPAGSPHGAPNRRTFGSVGAIVSAIGAVAVVLGFTVFNWFRDFGADSQFSDLKKLVDRADNLGIGFTPSTLYFDWLGWVLLVAAILTALLAVLPIVASKVWQIVGLVVGLVGAAMTFLAIKLADPPNGTGYGDYLKHANVGFYLAAGGFVVLGIGAAIGSRRN
jgi:hypothetical protein